jgi:hypothetical protein
MNKRQLIDEIRRYNTAVAPQFLAKFDDSALRQYLDHLQSAARKNILIASRGKRQPKLRVVA